MIQGIDIKQWLLSPDMQQEEHEKRKIEYHKISYSITKVMSPHINGQNLIHAQRVKYTVSIKNVEKR